MQTRASFLLAAIVVSFLSAPVISAQPHTGSLRGSVRDPNGVAVSGARVTLTDTATSTLRSTTASSEGEFALPALPAGGYRLQVEAAGYRAWVEEITLDVHQQRRADVRLAVGAPSEAVVVRAPSAAVRFETQAMGAVVDNRAVVALPLDGRNFLELSLLAPGAAPAPQGSASSVRGDFAVSVNGGREDANGFLLDGVDNVDPKLNTAAVTPAVDAIREFEVLTSTYDASIGRYNAGQVNVVLKSGANAPAGTGYEFFRDEAFDARNVFAPRDEPAPDYQRHQFGGSLGGPILRDRLFFFGNYEGTRRTEGITQVTNVPTAAERAGDFSQSLLAAPVNPFTGQPFPGNRIPSPFINPIGAAIASLYPLPNRDSAFSNYVSSPNLSDDVDQFDVRVDKSGTAALGLNARYSFADRRLFEPFSGPSFALVPGYGSSLARRAQNLTVGATSVITPALLNEARFGYTRVAAGVTQEGQGTSLNRSVGLPELSENPRDWGLSFITVTGYSPLGHEYNNPQKSATDAFQLTDTLTWALGRHLVKAGLDARAVRQDAFRDVQARGQLAFSGIPGQTITGNGLADLLLGTPLFTLAARVDNAQRLRTENVALFVQDHWRVSPRLSISGGLRYELTSPPVDAADRATIYDPASGGLVAVGTGGIPRAGYEPDRNNVAPRVGLSWALDADTRTVVRAGYGVFHGLSALAPSEGLYFSAPYYDLNFYFFLPNLPLTLFDPFPANYPFELPDSAFTVQRDLGTPLLQHWNVNLQRQLGASRVVELAYVGSAGSNLLRARDLNQPAPSTLPFVLRPNPRFEDITILESSGRSRYHALQARFEQRSASGLSMLAAYTLGKSLDDGSGFFASSGDPNFPQDSLNPRLEYGRSAFDVRHRLSIGATWDLPFGEGLQGVAAGFVEGWQVAAVATLQSGRPFTVALLPQLDNSNTGRSSLGFLGNDRPNLVGDPALDDPGTNRWFNTGAFAMPARGTFGNVGRNTLDGPGYRNVNLAVTKQLRLLPGARLDVRFEAFNLFNRTNLNQPDNFLGSPSFGQVLSAQSARRLQCGARISF